MLYHIKKNIAIVALLALSLAVHFVWFGHPNMTVFDEVHFGKFLSAYFTHQYYFDIHPPLGKLILAGWGYLWGFQPGFSFANIGDVFPDNAYKALRFLPALAGALLPLVIYGIARKFNMSRWAAFLAGLFVALDNALLVQSRLILLDSFLLLFGFTAILCYLHGINNRLAPLWLAASGILAAMAMSIKWTGLTFLGLIVVLEIIRIWRAKHESFLARNIFTGVIAFAIIPFVLYFSVFMLHFSLLTKTGTGDAFMTQRFQHDLSGNTNADNAELKSLTSLEKFVELNTQMYDANKRLTASHPYSSKWYSWPLLQRPIFYWVSGDSRIYLLGNPIVWWGSTVALLVVLIDAALGGWRRIDKTLIALAGAWVINLLPFVGISRVMFLYHYFTALIWAILILAYLVNHSKKPKRAAIALGALALVSFIFFAPLSYGLSLSPRAYDMRAWFSNWR